MNCMRLKRSYPSPGACIYCGESTRRLTDEHIIPESLGGRLVFREASCDSCRHKIEAFEGRLINGLFGSARAILGITSSKKAKPRKKLKVARRVNKTTARKVYTSRDDHPGNLIMETLKPPRFLTSVPPNPGPRSIGLIVKNLKHDPWKPNEYIELFAPIDTYLDFTRLLAKIAHGYWIAENPLALLHPVLSDLILGKSDIGHDYFIGSSESIRTTFDDLHHVQCSMMEHQGFTYGYVDISLFSCYPPFNGYRVYVGSVGREMRFILRPAT
jgi:hypothetical protein